MPPTACTPNTSSVSSTFSMCLRPLTPHRQTMPAARPITNAPGMPTLPAAGVIATRPATAPEAAPSIEGLPLNIHSPSVHDSTAHAVARNVFRNASDAVLPASSAEPALKPNQPNHSSEAPIIVIGRLPGAIASLPKPTRLPITYAPTRPAMPALMCTTVPPAKSSAPHCQMRPALAFVASTTFAAVYASGPAQNHTMCAIGQYENVNHSTENRSTAENLMRSANAPRMRHTVIAANVAWNATNTISGITTPFENVAAIANSPFAMSVIAPLRNSRSKPPKYALPSVNARL